MYLNNLFKYKNIFEYTRVGIGGDGFKVRSVTHFILVKMLRCVIDVKSIRGSGIGISDKYVLCKIKVRA